MNFEQLFITEKVPYKGSSKRDKFLSRVFGIVNEEIIRIWCANKRSLFTDLGRPTIYDSDGRYYTLDFLLKDAANNIFIAEMKCEIEYQKYQFLTLSNSKQIDHHRKKRAFQLFLEVASKPSSFQIKCDKQEIKVSGSVLIWGKVSPQEVSTISKDFSLAQIISVEDAVADLIEWKDQHYINFLNQYELWSKQLFSGLQSK